MSYKTTSKYLSKTERKRFDAMANWNSIKAAATALGVSPQTLYNWRLQIRRRYEDKRGWVNAVLAQTRRGGTLTNLLQKKVPMESLEEDFEEEEE